MLSMSQPPMLRIPRRPSCWPRQRSPHYPMCGYPCVAVVDVFLPPGTWNSASMAMKQPERDNPTGHGCHPRHRKWGRTRLLYWDPGQTTCDHALFGRGHNTLAPPHHGIEGRPGPAVLSLRRRLIAILAECQVPEGSIVDPIAAHGGLRSKMFNQTRIEAPV